jgi:hypothetical protein
MTAGKLAAIGAIAVVAAAIAAGLWVAGSPQEQRERRLDERRTADLRSLSNSVSRYYRETGKLPAELDSMVDGRTQSVLPRDPQSGQSYDYEISPPAKFRLCTEFLREAGSDAPLDFWAHAAGQQCFDFDLSAVRTD